jgi:hypothetical protein
MRDDRIMLQVCWPGRLKAGPCVSERGDQIQVIHLQLHLDSTRHESTNFQTSSSLPISNPACASWRIKSHDMSSQGLRASTYGFPSWLSAICTSAMAMPCPSLNEIFNPDDLYPHRHMFVPTQHQNSPRAMETGQACEDDRGENFV